jgi:D-glycero-D-manno-heptose 1,7-bisphosphate phosphatase
VAGRALFLDFGGTLARVESGRTVVSLDGNPVLMPNVAGTLAKIRPTFEACFLVSNQPRIMRGEITAVEVHRRFAWVNEQLGRPFTDWRVCPHVAEDGCYCRKPQPGMFLDLAKAHQVDLGRSTHVGDADKDREAARRAGIPVFYFASDFFGWSN